VWEVVQSLNGNKALGPNGFTMAFFSSKVLGCIEKGSYDNVFKIP
jgi:hypothetical protein